jgi:hypothetical protein
LRIGAVVGAILFLVQIFLRNPAPKRSDSADRPARPSSPPPRPESASKARATTTTNGDGAKARPDTPKQPAAKKPSSGTAATPATKPTEAKDSTPSTIAAAWVEPDEGACPISHPVKVKLASGIFHVPGGLAYDRTSPDRCYRDVAAAESDGFRPSKR